MPGKAATTALESTAAVLATIDHHSAVPRGQKTPRTRGEEGELHYTTRFQLSPLAEPQGPEGVQRVGALVPAIDTPSLHWTLRSVKKEKKGKKKGKGKGKREKKGKA